MTLEELIEALKNKADKECTEHFNNNPEAMKTLVEAMRSSNVKDKLKLLEITVLKTCAENSYIYQNLTENDKKKLDDLRCAISFGLPEIPAVTEKFKNPANLFLLWKHIEGKGKDLANNVCSAKDIKISCEKIGEVDKKVKNLDKKKTETWTAKFNEQIDLLKKIMNKEEFDKEKIDPVFLLRPFNSEVRHPIDVSVFASPRLVT